MTNEHNKEITHGNSLRHGVKQIDVNFLRVCPVIDHEFSHNIVKVHVGPRGYSRVDPQTTLTMFMTKFIANNRTDALKTDINLFFTTTNCQIARFLWLTRPMNLKFMCLSAY